MGITVTLPDPLAGGEVVFEYDRDAYKRGAGRKRKAAPGDSAIADMSESETDDLHVTILDCRSPLFCVLEGLH